MKTPRAVRTTILSFSLLLQLAAFCSRSDAAAGDVDLSFDPGSGVDGQVSAIVVQPDGKVLIGGSFSTVKGLLRTNLARLNADGSGDPTFDAGPTDNGVTAMALQPDGKLLVAGPALQTFCDESGCYSDYYGTVLRLNADGTRDNTFAAAVADYSSQTREFRCLVPLPDGKILVGGEFYGVNGTNRVGIARLHANGTLDTTFDAGPGLNGAVPQAVAQPDGKMLIAGNFTLSGGTNRFGVARLNANGSLDPTFDAGFVSIQTLDCDPQILCYEYTDITALTLQPNGKVLIGVWKRLYQSLLETGELLISDRYSVTRLNANGSHDPGFVFTNTAQIRRVGSLILQPDGHVLVRHGEVSTSRIHRLNANGSWDSSFHPGNTSGGANAAALQADGKVIIGGTSVSADAANGQRISRLNADGTRDLTFDAGQGLERAVSTVALQPNGQVLVGGPIVVGDPYWGPVSDMLAFINGTNRHGRARLNIDGSLDREFVPTPFHPPLEARYPGDCLGDPRFGCLHGFVSTALLPLADGKVLLAGTFITTIYGDEVSYQNYYSFLGRFDATGGLEIEFNLPDVYVNAMAQQPNGKVVIGGNLALNGSNSTVARLNYDGSVDGSFQLSQGPASVSCLVLQPDGRVVVGGANSVVRLNGSGTRDAAFGAVVLSNGGANALVVQPDGQVLLGGAFTAVNGTNRNRIARLNANGSLDASFHPGTGADGPVRSIALQPDGNVLIGGDFTTVNGVVRPHVARLYGAAAPPALSIVRWNASLIIAWPVTGLNSQLQESTDLSLPNSWSPVVQSTVTNAAQISVTVPTGAGAKFFRLKVQ